jgi:mannose-6-phosphate isomerase
MVWGGRQLGEVLGKPLPSEGAFGEAWEISDHPSHASVVADGPHKGQTLRSLMEQQPEWLLGKAAGRSARFPWLVKLLDAWDWLSVQVHPNERDVIRLRPGEGSKTEAWFVLVAAPTSRVYAGLLPGVDEKHLRSALREGTVGDCLHQFQPQSGDCVFLPAGTVHAVGGGVLMAEVQQTSDATFRLFDWNRRDASGKMRPLHLEEALSCINWDSGPVQPVHVRNYSGERGCASGPTVERGWHRQRLVKCDYFTLEYFRYREPFTFGGTGSMQVLLVAHGQGRLWTREGVWLLRAGDTLLLPAVLGSLTCHPEGEMGFLLSSLPDNH